MADIKDQLIKDSYNYVLQSDLSTGVVYRIGGDVPVSPIFSSGLTINGDFNYSNGTEQPGYVLTTNGSGSTYWSSVSGSSGISGEGTTGYLPKWTGSTGLGNSLVYDATTGVTIGTGFTWDNTNGRLGIGTSSPTSSLFIKGSGATNSTSSLRVETSASRMLLQVEDGGTTRISGPTHRLYVGVESGGYAARLVVNGEAHFSSTGLGNAGATYIDQGGTGGSSRTIWYDENGAIKNLIQSNGVSYFNGGNFLIGTSTDAGYKLNVNGTARVQGNTEIINSSGASLLTLGGFNNLPELRFINTNTKITVDANNAINFVSAYGNVSNHYLFYPASNLSNTSTTGVVNGVALNIGFAPTSGTASFNQLSLVQTINQTGGANGITRGIYVNPTLTSAADFRAIETTAGDVLFQTGSTRLLFVNSKGSGNGNVIIGNTTIDRGDKLQVEGSVRVGSVLLTNTIYPIQNQNLLISAAWADSTQVVIETITNKAQVLIVRPGANLTLASGTHDTQRITHTFQPTSGNASVNGLTLNQTINQLSGASGTTRGIYINPTISAATDFRAIETTSGKVILNGENVLIGTSTDAGFKLDVNGTARVTGNLLIGQYSNSLSLLRFANVTNDGNSAYIGKTASVGFEINAGSVSEFRIQVPPGADTNPLTLYGNGVRTAQFYRNQRSRFGGNLSTNPSSTVEIIGEGTTSSTTALRVGNTTGATSLEVKDDGNIYVNQTINKYIYGYGGTYIKFYDDLTGGIDIYNLNGTSTTRIFGGLYASGNLSVGGSFSMNGNLNIGNGNYLSADNSNYNRIYPYNGANASMRFIVGHPTVGHFEWEYPINTTLMTLKRTGNLLIGTTTDAGYKLDVNGTGRFSGNLELNAGNNGRIFINNVYPQILFGKTGTPSWSVFVDTENSGQFEIGTGAGFPYNTFSSKLYISTGGNIGIGVLPSYKLDVNGTTRVSGATILQGAVAVNSTNVSTGYALFVNGVIGTTSLTLTQNLTMGENYAISNNGSQTIDIDANNDTTNAVFRVTANGTANELFRVNESGNFGIGTISPTQKLQVSGNTLIEGSLTATTKTTIGSESDISCALLQMASTTQGVLFPRMTNAQRTSIVSPQPSLMVYCTDSPEGLFIYKSTGWVQII